MGYRMLYVWVEGDSDSRFFESVMRPLYEAKYDYVYIVKYRTMKEEKVNKFLKSIESMGAEYIFVGDINASESGGKKKEELKQKYGTLHEDRIAVVRMEIESWYLAGLDAEHSRKMGITHFATTDTVTKEQFKKERPSRFDSEIDFMVEILNHYSLEVAKQKNKSLKDFIRKYDC